MIPRKNLLRLLAKSTPQPGYAWRAFGQRFCSWVSYHLRDGTSSCPETISLFLTYRCNLRCKMCGQWGEHGTSKQLGPEALKSELAQEETEPLVHDLASFRPNITLFGGEPLLYKGWADLVAHVKNHRMRCNIITNGTLLENHAKTVVDLGVDEIIFSLDGPRDLHDEVRGAPGTFDRSFRGFAAIRDEKQQRRSQKPLINITATIFEINYQRMDEVIDVAEELKAGSVTFHHLIFLSPDIYTRHNEIFEKRFGATCPDWAGFVRDSLPDIRPAQLIERMNQIRRRPSRVHVSFYPNFTEEEIKQYYTRFEFVPTSYANRCLSPWMVSYIFPDGSVRPFHSIGLTLGNIRNSDFASIWNGEKYRHYRRTVRQMRRFPVCTRCTEHYRF